MMVLLASVQSASGTTPSMAALPGSGACVCVGPPLLARGPSSGVGLLRSPVPPRQVASLLRLCPREVIVPLQLGPGFPVLPATIVFLSFTVPPELKPELKMPPPSRVALLPVTVLLLKVIVALQLGSLKLTMPPPTVPALLPLTVLLMRVAVEEVVPVHMLKMPPPSPVTVL